MKLLMQTTYLLIIYSLLILTRPQASKPSTEASSSNKSPVTLNESTPQ